MLILLAGVSVHWPENLSLIKSPLQQASASDDVSVEAAQTWRRVWQTIVLSSGFLIVLMTFDTTSVTPSVISSKNSSLWNPLVICSLAGLCSLASAPNLWVLFGAGRLCHWPILIGFRQSSESIAEHPSEFGTTSGAWNVFWNRIRNDFWGNRSHETDRTVDPVVMLMWREVWSMAFMFAGLAILALWTRNPSLSLSELRDFHPGVQQTSLPGIAGLLFVIVGAGWTIPLHLETLDIAETGDYSSSVWLLIVQSLSAVITVTTVVVGTSLGHIVPSATILIILAGWSFVLGSYVVRRQIHLRRFLAGLMLVQSGWCMTSIALAAAQKKMGEFAPNTELMFPLNESVVPFLIIADLTAIIGFAAICRFVLNDERELTYMDDLRGLLRHQPLAASLAAAVLLSLCGLPLTAGFWGRWQIACGLWSVQMIQPRSGLPVVHGGFFILGFAAIVSQFVVMQTLWQPLRMILFEAPAGRIASDKRQAALSVAILAAFVTIGIGMMPDALLRVLRRIVSP